LPARTAGRRARRHRLAVVTVIVILQGVCRATAHEQRREGNSREYPPPVPAGFRCSLAVEGPDQRLDVVVPGLVAQRHRLPLGKGLKIVR
jgi:hypothetical protein